MIIKFLDRELIDKVLQFFNNAQSDKVRSFNRSRKEFEWLFFEGLKKPSLYSIAWDDDSKEIIGTYAGIYIPMVLRPGEPVLTLKGEDTILSLDSMIKFGKRDVLNEMLLNIEEKSKADNVKFIWGFTTAKSSFQRCGFKIISQINWSFYVIKPIIFYKYRLKQFPQQSVMKKLRLWGFSWYNFFRQRFLSFPFTQISFRQIRFDEIEEKILLTFLPGNVYTLYLNKKFLKWRIIDNPSTMTYELLEFRDEKGFVISYFIFSHNQDNIYFVEQFLFAGHMLDREKIQIMKLSFNFLKKRKAAMIRAMGFSNNVLNVKEMKLLKKAGFYFIKNKKASYFIFKNLADPAIDAKDIYLSRLNTLGIV
ncbi:MAG: hypothetical protein MUO72_16735 [Bacteroidales bacterium]|nr:hypothetical protein [Bacteroidales bacterium]